MEKDGFPSMCLFESSNGVPSPMAQGHRGVPKESPLRVTKCRDGFGFAAARADSAVLKFNRPLVRHVAQFILCIHSSALLTVGYKDTERQCRSGRHLS